MPTISQSLVFLVLVITTKLANSNESDCECLSSIKQSDCGIGEVLVTKNCCPVCDGTGNKVCSKCSKNKDCAKGLYCDEKSKICSFDKNSCYYLAHINPDVPLQWKPDCAPNGDFAAKQCRGDKVSGRCFCFSEKGERIFGWDWRFNEDEMTCACSRHRSKLEASGRISTLHCQQNGNYEELQCDGGACFCVDTKTGQLLAGTKVLPDNLWTKLPCYNRTLHGDSYVRQCESVAVLQKKVVKIFELHGTKDVAVEMASCNYDGSYGKHKLQQNEVKCTWRDGSVINPYAGKFSQISQIDCACAIDEKIYEESNKPALKLTCSTNGNYEEVQLHQIGKYYCVDALGYAVSDFQTDELTKEICNNRRYDRIETESYCKKK
ncbi:uncharacterized protein LOC134832705 [Culicoides brevitarsis]|uniref:uncharacterized protein LOC134832705 n=1 Tax=Culicoides brevitarsis TaxID=469753 RepID=UPI00307BC279